MMRSSRFLSVLLLFFFVFPAISIADPLEDAKTAIDNADYEKARELLSPLAEGGNAEAQTRLGVMYINGQGVERNLVKGLSLVMAAANEGYDVAQACALGVNMDLAREGNTGAMYNVGGMCLKGWGGEQDKAVCLKWLEEAAKLGHVRSAEMLNKIYKEGLYDIPRDKDKASEWKDVAKGFEKGMDGSWAGAVPGGLGDQDLYLSFTFKVKDGKLSGTTLDARWNKIPLEECKIDGNNFSFKVATKWQGTDMIHSYTGTFLGNALHLTYTTDMGDGPGPPTTFIATRNAF